MQRKEPPPTSVCLIDSSISYFFKIHFESEAKASFLYLLTLVWLKRTQGGGGWGGGQVPFQLMLNIRVPKSVSEEVPALRSRVLHLTDAVD